jgi:ribonuclease BN (tRNA processing enzyme)
LLDPAQAQQDRRALRHLPAVLVDTVRGADLLIADAQYTDEEYRQKAGWGHPSAGTVVDLAVQAGVKRLAFTHHDPMHSDKDVDLIVLEGQSRARAHGAKIDMFGAREGITLKI